MRTLLLSLVLALASTSVAAAAKNHASQTPTTLQGGGGVMRGRSVGARGQLITGHSPGDAATGQPSVVKVWFHPTGSHSKHSMVVEAHGAPGGRAKISPQNQRALNDRLRSAPKR